MTVENYPNAMFHAFVESALVRYEPYAGVRAAKVLAQAASVLVAFLLLGGLARAQDPAPAPPGTEPFAISDNSFFVEEAFNQEPKIFQNIFGLLRTGRQWSASFTQEWPVPSVTHQLSYTVAWTDTIDASGVGDALINYRYQVLEEGKGRPACAPRASLILPTGRAQDALGWGSPGVQVNVPFSKQLGDLYFHWNAGTTWLFRAKQRGRVPSGNEVRKRSLVSPFVAGSVIYRLRPMFHPMLETVVSSDAVYGPDGLSRTKSVIVSPGFRMGWNLGRKQFVVGAAAPVSRSRGETEAGIFGYLSYELPFKK